MAYRISLGAAALLSCLSLSTVAIAAQLPSGSVSGPASGTNVVPSTAAQKQMMEGRSAAAPSPEFMAEVMGALVAVGAPGIEGAPNTQSGR
jgi:hypothetical protein